VPLARVPYPNDGFSHQGWLTEDQRHFLHGDELDEVSHGIGTTTRVWDVRDLDDPVLIGVFENDTTSIDHNLYTEGRVAFASNYTSGLRIYDLRRVAEGTLSEVAYFDVYPENDNATFEGGTWSNYPYFRQKKIVAVSSIDRGLFVLRPRGAAGV
jgi:choice-of-anchor B domain-containing protein